MNATLSPKSSGETDVVARLRRFRGELAEFAFALETRRKLDAADAVNAIAARIAEIEAELSAAAQPSAP